jgi:hypothetical protein
MTPWRQSTAPPLAPQTAVAAALGLGGTVAVALANPKYALQGWLGAAFAWSGVPLGALGLLLLHALTGGPWKRPLAPLLYASAWTLPVIALAFVPVMAAPSLLYPWAGSGAGLDPLITAKATYLNPTFFALRTILYFAIWIALTALISARAGWQRAHRRAIAAVGIMVYSLAVSFAAVDWAMSVDPGFASSVFGMLVGIADLLAALAFAISLVAWLGSPNIRAAAEQGRVRGALAGLLASGVLLWAYLSFMQYLVVWSGDIPEEASWYLDRVAGAWGAVPWALGLLLGIVPVAALALPTGRRSLERLAAISALIFVMRFIEAAWLVLPSFGWRSWLQPLAFLTATLGLGGLLLAGVLWLWMPRQVEAREVAQHG